MKKNPLKNLNTMLKLNPYAKTARRMALLAEEQRVKAKKEKLDKKRKQISKEEATTIKGSGKAWYQTMISDSDYTEFENFTKWLGVSQ
ncbi:60S ribosomal protein [Actinidia chinensis var. chinensis]|uniref:60S ribosomal protein n=1 Tax=Actinidia chinensis var. chinensis TaxID=1590841 RepID=A0A2R6RYB0_ACTCC|nr:60S ribosomal protein [Actinidia chinensis var. chinensis]